MDQLGHHSLAFKTPKQKCCVAQISRDLFARARHQPALAKSKQKEGFFTWQKKIKLKWKAR